MPESSVQVGIRVPHGLFAAGPERLFRFTTAVEAAGLDRIWVGDHVSFRGGQGYDGLIQTAVLSAITRKVTVQTAVYLLPLRHPVPVARQVASIAEMAPGRFVFGVGVGGDDKAETANCGVDPAQRGQRMDEALDLVRRLLVGEVLDHSGPVFPLSGASIRPVPREQVSVAVGGRSAAALGRAGRLSEGWLGVFISPDRYTECLGAVTAAAGSAGREAVEWRHGLVVWCGFGPTREEARRRVAPAVESLYRLPFERFEPYVPCGTPDDVAGALLPYLGAGASYLLLAPVTPDPDEGIEGASVVRRALRGLP